MVSAESGVRSNSEKSIPSSYLKRLNGLYDDWFKRYKLSPVVVLETEIWPVLYREAKLHKSGRNSPYHFR